jgi:hypothetical protein
MTQYFLVSANGTEFGRYPADDAQGARDACARDMGCRDEADLAASLGEESQLEAVDTTESDYTRLSGYLATLTTRDTAGRHFTRTLPDGDILALETAGLINIHRPVHPGTGLAYAEEFWSVEVTPEGRDFLDQHRPRLTHGAIDERIQELIPPDLWARFLNLSYAEMAEQPELAPWREELLEAELDWWAASDAT